MAAAAGSYVLSPFCCRRELVQIPSDNTFIASGIFHVVKVEPVLYYMWHPVTKRLLNERALFPGARFSSDEPFCRTPGFLAS